MHDELALIWKKRAWRHRLDLTLNAAAPRAARHLPPPPPPFNIVGQPRPLLWDLDAAGVVAVAGGTAWLTGNLGLVRAHHCHPAFTFPPFQPMPTTLATHTHYPHTAHTTPPSAPVTVLSCTCSRFGCAPCPRRTFIAATSHLDLLQFWFLIGKPIMPSTHTTHAHCYTAAPTPPFAYLPRTRTLPAPLPVSVGRTDSGGGGLTGGVAVEHSPLSLSLSPGQTTCHWTCGGHVCPLPPPPPPRLGRPLTDIARWPPWQPRAGRLQRPLRPYQRNLRHAPTRGQNPAHPYP